MAFEYRWDSTLQSASNVSAESAVDKNASDPLDLEYCFLYEYTTYDGNQGTYQNDYFSPSNPPFVEWRFRNPTDGRTAPVALGYFAASQGWAWDRHKLGGKLFIPDDSTPRPEISYAFVALQQYRFHCQRCGMDAPVPGATSGPHAITRTFAPLSHTLPPIPTSNWMIRDKDTVVWRYTLQKHGHTATYDINAWGDYVDDSAHLGFGPR